MKLLKCVCIEEFGIYIVFTFPENLIDRSAGELQSRNERVEQIEAQNENVREVSTEFRVINKIFLIIQ